jgi:hypothetical protein
VRGLEIPFCESPIPLRQKTPPPFFLFSTSLTFPLFSSPLIRLEEPLQRFWIANQEFTCIMKKYSVEKIFRKGNRRKALGESQKAISSRRTLRFLSTFNYHDR